MKKESGNKGITKVCPDCHKVLFSGGNFLGIIKTKCECGIKWQIDAVEVKKIVVKLTKILVIVAIILTAIGIQRKINAKKTPNCDSFKTQEDAQKLFDTDRKKYQVLDKNYNNIACEDLKQ